MPRLNAWTEYCREHPTLRNMVQSYLGIETKKKEPERPGTADELLEMLAIFPGAQKV